MIEMKRVLRMFIIYIFASLAFVVLDFVVMVIPFVGALFAWSHDLFGYNIVVLAVVAVLAVTTYINVYVIKPEMRQKFSRENENGYDRKRNLLMHMKNGGYKDIIAFAIYSFPAAVLNLIRIGNTNSPLGRSVIPMINAFVYAPQAFFYTVDVPFAGFLMSIVFFSAVYAVAIVLLYRQWYNKKKGRTLS
jgi:hypothetical protein